ncbi:hypothetical protein [Ktedonospora formicarum]|uniref:Uncharacterized protein n=1 Tax=Ktedonospora formicarum TaxID=2778364 RepID=A0A8J3MW05_9CHLR|nr:hypothetical protein [Ktedonospora formicarum]GHO48476.1 hypothetical protein KSX_66390 [Ktedonospora formicarum]
MRYLASRRPVGYWFALMLLLIWCSLWFSMALREGMRHTFVVPLLELVLALADLITLVVFMPVLIMLGRLCWLRLSSSNEEKLEAHGSIDLLLMGITMYVLWKVSPTPSQMMGLLTCLGFWWYLRGRIEEVRLLQVLGGLCWLWTLLVAILLPQTLWIFAWCTSMALTIWITLLLVGGRLFWQWLQGRDPGRASRGSGPQAHRQTRPLYPSPPHE